jgi:hypothetical protein
VGSRPAIEEHVVDDLLIDLHSFVYHMKIAARGGGKCPEEERST